MQRTKIYYTNKPLINSDSTDNKKTDDGKWECISHRTQKTKRTVNLLD